MKSSYYRSSLFLFLAAGLFSCSSSTTPTATPGYLVTPLVSDISGYGARTIDSNLKNPWGIAYGPNNTPFWISNNHTGSSTLYDTAGTKNGTFVKIGGFDTTKAGSPTGVVYNPNPASDFALKSSHGNATYIFAGEDGTISGSNPPYGTDVMVDNHLTSSYKGIAIGNSKLYAANFKLKSLDIFSSSFGRVSTTYDPTLDIQTFAPFNAQFINDQLYVTYALPNADGDDTKGLGNGFIDKFSNDGVFQSRFASKGTLNSPWGMTVAPASFGSYSGKLLVGNFGDGTINIFNLDNGSYVGQLKNAAGAVITIDGLWALSTRDNKVYYTAGPNGEAHGVFGVITLK